MNITGYMDLHTHILPGVDDGSKDWDMTEAMLRRMHEQGVRTIVATPHNYPREPRQENEKIRELCRKVDELAKQIDSSMTVLTGNEVFYREGIIREIEREHILTLNDSRYILIEFHPRSPKGEIIRGLRELTENGYAPIVAHVERVDALFWDDKTYSEVLASGCYIQTNCESLMGGMFDRGARRLRKLIENGKIHFLGSDCHNLSSRPPMMEECIAKLRKSISAESLERLTSYNVGKFLNKEYI